MNWLLYAVLGTLSLSGMFLAIKKLGTIDIKPNTILVYLFIVASILFIVYNIITKNNLLVAEKNTLLLLMLVGIFSFLGNLFLTKSMLLAKNPGYTLVISSTNVILVTVGSYFLFKSEITITKLIGMVIALIGIIMVII